MKLTEAQISIMQEDISSEIIRLLMEDMNYSMEDAFSIWYNSDTFERMQNQQTGLYYQSSGYVYSFLLNEIQTGIVA
ncbi:MAG: hypothetical protein J6X43_11790 [Bacteroidales bacterium]|nr:hypothetical protein [Bacteroidales bacterium]